MNAGFCRRSGAILADVFISYARADAAFVERLSDVLEGLGLSVWWDRKLETGAEFEMEIERQLDQAKAVIAVWSEASLNSVAVRAEAREGLDQGKLTPVRVDAVKPPLFSRGIQFEDLSDWDGDTAAIEFQDLYSQLVALRDGVAAASFVPRDDATALSAAPQAEEASARRLGPFRSAASLLLTLLSLGGLGAMVWWRVELFGPYWESVFALAGAALLLFWAGERELAPHVKAMVARWLRPQPNAKPLRSAVAFLAMFQAVFGARHLSLGCLWASTLASVGLYAALLFLFVPVDVLQPLALDLWENGPQVPEPVTIVGDTYVSSGLLETNAALLFLAVPIANIVVDYLSLWQTRAILRWSAGGAPLSLGVVLDALLTGAVFVACLPLGPVAFVLGLAALEGGVDEAAIATAWSVAEEIWRTLWVFVTVGWPGEALSAVAGEANVPNTALLIAFVTTFTTSAWLWFALLFAPVVRLLSWTRRRGLSALGAAVDTRARPIAPLGYVAAGVILGLGAAAAEVTQALAVPQRVANAELAPGTVFKDCDVCPEMVAIPGGSFRMGSPEDEEGREPLKDRFGILEGPQTEVTVAPFAMGRFEVTFREWDACVAATAALPDAQRCREIPRGQQLLEVEFQGQTYQLAFGDQGWGRGLRPVITVSWEDSQVYVAWLNRKLADRGVAYRLPSEAEWEYAARAGTTTAYSFEGDPDKVACAFMNGGDASAGRANEQWARQYFTCDDGYAFTAPVGAYRPNAFGLFDMHGNVAEWVEDCYHAGYEGRPTDGAAWMETRGGDCSLAVLRGGSWFSSPRSLRSAFRSRSVRGNRLNFIGFRVARVSRTLGNP